MADRLRRRLDRGIATLGLDLDGGQQELLLTYQGLLAQWNKAFNLTAIRDPEQMIVRHLLDSLAVLPHLEGGRFADVGTGPGLPGIPLAIADPSRQFVLLDSNGKKTRFLFQVKRQLGLSNIDIVESRVEAWQPALGFDGITTRAFADLSLTCAQCAHLLQPGGRIYALKSQQVDREIAALTDDWTVEDNVALSVPGLAESRWLTVLSRRGLQEHS